MISQPTPSGRRINKPIRVLVKFTKQMKNPPMLWCTFLHQYLILKWITHPTIPCTHSMAQWADWKINLPMLTEKFAPPLCQLFFGLVPTQNNIHPLLELSYFRFFLVYTRVRRVKNWYIIIYSIKKHHFTWTSVLNCLIGLFKILIQTQYLFIWV